MDHVHADESGANARADCNMETAQMLVPTMTKKQFDFIANVIKRMEDGASWNHEEIATHFADWLASANQQFNRGKFLTVAGVQSNV